jgi:hypothetical protein
LNDQASRTRAPARGRRAVTIARRAVAPKSLGSVFRTGGERPRSGPNGQGPSSIQGVAAIRDDPYASPLDWWHGSSPRLSRLAGDDRIDAQPIRSRGSRQSIAFACAHQTPPWY